VRNLGRISSSKDDPKNKTILTNKKIIQLKEIPKDVLIPATSSKGISEIIELEPFMDLPSL
jgi:hypothetical protein